MEVILVKMIYDISLQESDLRQQGLLITKKEKILIPTWEKHSSLKINKEELSFL